MRLALAAAAAIIAAPSAPALAQLGNSPVAAADGIFAGARHPATLAAQVLLDRADFSPGVIDGAMGANTARALRAYQRAAGLPADGRITPALLDHLRAGAPGGIIETYTITEEDAEGPFVDVPATMEAMAGMAVLAYETPVELLAEKFHMDQDLLRALNPGADFGQAGTRIRVVATGRSGLGGKVARIEVDKADSSVRAFAADGSLLGRFPATVGSASFPSPNGVMEVRAVAPVPKYYFSPDGRSWGPDRNLTIAAGPNNPVGGTWIDLSKDGYGIHGTPDPNLIGKTASHGCVRLTNWDAEELAKAVSRGTKVVFV